MISPSRKRVTTFLNSALLNKKINKAAPLSAWPAVRRSAHRPAASARAPSLLCSGQASPHLPDAEAEAGTARAICSREGPGAEGAGGAGVRPASSRGRRLEKDG